MPHTHFACTGRLTLPIFKGYSRLAQTMTYLVSGIVLTFYTIADIRPTMTCNVQNVIEHHR